MLVSVVASLSFGIIVGCAGCSAHRVGAAMGATRM
jgi:hypothetical protein